jgi:hypothetical protein
LGSLSESGGARFLGYVSVFRDLPCWVVERFGVSGVDLEFESEKNCGIGAG